MIPEQIWSYSFHDYVLFSAGSSIVTVEASDNDAGNNAQIKYVLHRGGRDNFAIDPTSGVISVATNADLDIEKFGDQYDITVSDFKVLFDYTWIWNHFGPTRFQIRIRPHCQIRIHCGTSL